jgi:periplasmic glucans biosynthesis protein
LSIVTEPTRERRPLRGLPRGLHRRGLLAGALGLGPFFLLAGGLRPARAEAALGEPMPFTAEWLREHARALAAADYRPPGAELPSLLAELTYDQHRDIRFRREAALWHGQGLDAEVQFFHLGHLLQTPVHIFEVVDGTAREVLYGPELFDYGRNELDAGALPRDLGFAGFRLHTPLNRPDYLDEVVAFLGASYFRAVGRGQRYGLSARGIAIDTGLPNGEEFPDFRAFWLERPAAGAETFHVHALLDGPGLTGAYSFAITPGAATRMEVQATLFARRSIELLGVAPLTSMYLFGGNDRVGVDDFRPSVHDSEGLQIWTGRGDWLWRPLANPKRLQLSIFRDENPRGFGLLQRTRDFAAYHDLEARYELRPSLWVEPLGEWGRGQVRLLELPTDEEVHDNIAAFWAPETPLEGGSELALAYRLHWCETPPVRPEGAEVVDMRVGQGGVPGQERDPASRKIVLDFAGGQLDALPADSRLEAVITVSEGELQPPVVQKNEAAGGWRVFFDWLPAGEGPAEFRGHLRLDEQVLSEIWVYQWTAE